MNLDFNNFIKEAIQNPVLLVIMFLILGVIFVNGWIDAPNSIATSVSTHSIKPKNALIMAGIFNFLGVFVMSFISTNVAKTMYNMVNFGNDNNISLIAICSAMIAVIIWVMLAWHFGFPTSQSHALVAGISGASIAVYKSMNGINYEEWKKVIYGLIISVIFGFILGYFFTKVIEKICRKMDRRKTIPFFKKTQVISGAAMTFMNAAQDSQKFAGIFLLGVFLANNVTSTDSLSMPIWLMFLISTAMTVGTFIGGYKVIKTIGTKITKLEPYQGTAADLGASTALLVSSLTGIPISTGHTKVTSIMGVGAAKRFDVDCLHI